MEVGLDLQPKSVPGKDLPHLLAGLLHLPGAQGAGTQEVVAVEAHFDWEVGQLGQQEQSHDVAGLCSIVGTHNDIEKGGALFDPDLLAVPEEGLLRASSPPR